MNRLKTPQRLLTAWLAVMMFAAPAFGQDNPSPPPAGDAQTPAPTEEEAASNKDDADKEGDDADAKGEGEGNADDATAEDEGVTGSDEEVEELSEDGEVVELDEDGEVVELDEDGEVVELDEDGEVVELDEDGETSGEDDLIDEGRDGPTIAPVVVTATAEEIARVGGSAHVIDEEALKEMEYDDAHSVLLRVPGLYVRQEDAFGLRPNIGLRGANSDRSKKVALMEDGILFGPAPYSAPAAYYFPLMTRMAGVEVYKGPAAVRYGPNTIGGAVNLISRDIPYELTGGADLAWGMFNTGKLHLHVGDSADWGGFLIEGVHLQSDGFKELDGGGDTGFSKSEVIFKGQLNSDLNAERFHRVRLRLGFARELSNETYLGLSDADFDDNPYRRYSASQLARMDWWRTEARLSYRLDIGDMADVTMTLYRHDLSRAWRKLNRFLDGPSLEDILSSPESGRRRVYYDVLTGAADSTESETLQIGTNDRSYVSQGFQLEARFTLEEEPDEARQPWWSSELRFGMRVHNDGIERNHTEDSFLMTSGELVGAGADTLTTTLNNANARALALYVSDITSLGRLTLAPGLRFEFIQTDFHNRLTNARTSNTQQVALPGLGLHYAFTPELGALAGVHRGFSPVAPGQPDGVEPELSVNYELGLRYLDAQRGSLLELVGFFNDYNNLTGECSFSAGCADEQLDQQFNAGEVVVYGVETVADHEFKLTRGGLALPVRLAYTLTMTQFQSSFNSNNPQFGEVLEDDELPYVPTHQASLTLGLNQGPWRVTTVTTFVDEMREQAGQGPGEPGELTDRTLMIDVSGSWNFWQGATAYLKADNILNAQPIASRRPFGARPARPLLVQGGLKVDF